MNPATIFHKPLSEYAFALDDTHYVFRLRTGSGEAVSCKFYYADRAIMTPELEFFCVPMKKFREDQYFDWYEIRLETSFERIAYYFELFDEAESLCYYGDCYEMIGQPNRADYFQLPFNHRADRLVVPEWTKDAIVYNIFPDSFADEKRKISCNSEVGLGGTIRGIANNLDYIASMGFNCIYMNPIFKAESYHRYDTLDYYEIDPQMGTKDDLKAMVEKAHSMGIRVILDGVFNHISSSHFMFRDVLEHGRDSEYYPYFYQLPENPKIPEPNEYPEYTCFSYVANMPKTNTADLVIGKPGFRCNVCWIDVNHEQAGQLAANYLLDKGYRRMALIMGQEDDSLSQSRLTGIRQAMAEEELTVEVVCNESPYALDDAALDNLLIPQSRPEVLLCSNNHLALHCLQHIRRFGLKIPEDIALLTFDNYPFSMLTDPTITAVEVDMHDMGVNAARFVLQRIRKPNMQTQSYCTSPCILEREST